MEDNKDNKDYNDNNKIQYNQIFEQELNNDDLNKKISSSDINIKKISLNEIKEYSIDESDEEEEEEEEEEKKENNKDNKENRYKKKRKSLVEISYINDINEFESQDFIERKYDKKTLESGKLFFKYRFIKENMEKSKGKFDLRSTTTLNFNLNKVKGLTRSGTISDKRLSLPSKSFFTNNSRKNNDNNNEEKFNNNKSEYRKYNGKFLLLLEKSIFNFNLKKYEESYNILLQEHIINSKAEFGEFLLVVNGYNKYILGTFLAKDKPPNDKKEILNSFVNSIKLKYKANTKKTNSFLECLRFFLSRLKLPEDSNLILEIMDEYSNQLFNINKDDEEFVKKFSSASAIYLLVSIILALNTMFTRKDIKNMNMIKKEQFIEMNKEIDKNEAQDIYEKLELEPISMKDNYSENNYKRLSILVKKNDNVVNSNISKFAQKNENGDKEEDKNLINGDTNGNIINDNNEDNENENSNLNINLINDEKNEDSINEPFSIKKSVTSARFNIKNRENIIRDEKSNYKDDFSIRQSSFSYQANLESFSDNDKEILSKPHKFIKLISKSNHHQRTFIVDEKMEKLKWAKDFEIIVNSDKSVKIKKVKGTEHSLLIKDIEDVYNGIDNSELISEYIKLFPNESKEASNFITILSPYKPICIKAFSQEIALSWFKALKSLVLKTNGNKKNENNNKNEKLRKLMDFKEKGIKKIWNKFILPNWDKYGQFLQYKLKNKINDINKIDENSSKNGLLEEKLKYNLIEQCQFIVNAKKKLSENNLLDYNEFFYLYKLGLPKNLRNKIWTLLIRNICGITLDLYKSYFNYIKDIDFEELIKDYEQNNNINQTIENLEEEDETNKYIINQILMDIIEIKKLFKPYMKNEYKILPKVYRIVKIFFLMRPDISYNKSLINFAFIFMLECRDEFISFRNIFNLICSNNTLQYYLKNETYIRIRVEFFEELLKNQIPKVREHFKNLDISTELFLVSWFENIFSFTFDFKLLIRIFDLYLLEGEYVLFQVGLTIIKIQENELLNLTIGEVFKNLGKLPSNYKMDIFLEKMNLNNIYEQFEKWKTENEVGNRKIKLMELVF